jgi:hypothetical protein
MGPILTAISEIKIDHTAYYKEYLLSFPPVILLSLLLSIPTLGVLIAAFRILTQKQIPAPKLMVIFNSLYAIGVLITLKCIKWSIPMLPVFIYSVAGIISSVLFKVYKPGLEMKKIDINN